MKQDQGTERTPQTDLDELRRLLFAEELRTLNVLANREAQLRTAVQDLPQVVTTAHQKNTQALNKALEAPILHMLTQLGKRDTTKISEALSPVILPAIGKAVQSSLRHLTETVDQTLAHSFSAQGLKWRMQAWRTGESFASIVLKNTLDYRIEQAFLIQTESGLLLAHEAHPSVAVQDTDAVSAMLTAIRDFSSQMFAQNSGSTLDSVEIGEHTLWLLSGRTSYLALVIRGNLPLDIKEQLEQYFAEMQRHYHDTFGRFNGDRTELPDCAALLQPCLLSVEQTWSNNPNKRANSTKKSTISPQKLILGGMALAGVAWLCYAGIQTWRTNQVRERFLEACRQTPGLWVVDAREVANQWRVRILRDPLATAPQKLAENVGIVDENVQFDVLFVQSMMPEMIVARARQLFQAPSTVDLKLEDGLLTATGSASWEWKQQFSNPVSLPSGISRVDVSGVRADGWLEADALLQKLEAIPIEFEQDRQLTNTAPENLVAALPLIQRLVQLDQRMGLGLEIALVGSSTEDSPLSSTLRRARSDVVLTWFVEHGVLAGFFLPVANVGMPTLLPGVRNDRVNFEVTFRQRRS